MVRRLSRGRETSARNHFQKRRNHPETGASYVSGVLYALVKAKLMSGSVAFVIAVFSIGIFSAHALEAFSRSAGRK